MASWMQSESRVGRYEAARRIVHRQDENSSLGMNTVARLDKLEKQFDRDLTKTLLRRSSNVRGVSTCINIDKPADADRVEIWQNENDEVVTKLQAVVLSCCRVSVLCCRVY